MEFFTCFHFQALSGHFIGGVNFGYNGINLVYLDIF